MQILSVTNNTLNYFSRSKECQYLNLKLNNDTVSFSSKKYNIDSIENPTNHCAYCGCKVYTKSQIESIAQEMLILKSSRLQGKIRSVLEKLEGAKYSDEIAIAKRIENNEEIEFFKNFLDVSSKKSFLDGQTIMREVYKKEKEQAFNILTKNMLPMMRTIDHISPQNKKEENNNIDINLVEACYCCNHDLKKGVSFNEFFAMFPSIQHNMPVDKFNYARSHILENGQSAINRKLSVSNILKSLNRLFIQRNETIQYLNSIDYRISCIKLQIDDAIKNLQNDIDVKNTEISDLKKQLDELNKNPEFLALQQYENLSASLTDIKKLISDLRAKHKNISNNLQKTQKIKRSGKNSKYDKKIEELNKILADISNNIKIQKNKQFDIIIQIEQLKMKFPYLCLPENENRTNLKIIEKIKSLENQVQILTGLISDLEAQKSGEKDFKCEYLSGRDDTAANTKPN